MRKEYKVINKELSPKQWAYLVCAIQRSEKYDINDVSHIFVRDTGIEIGYIGEDTFELVEPNNPELKGHHKNIILIYNSALREFYKNKMQRKGKGIANLVLA